MKKLTLSIVLIFGVPAALQANSVPYYIGVDGRTTIPSGTYAGLENPNLDRLTLLYNHGDHYHSKGVFVHTGPNLGDSTAVIVGPSNYVPEGAAPPFELKPGHGVFAGLRISGLTPDVEGSDIRIGSVDTLAVATPGSDENILFNSSGGRWTTLLAEADLVIELVYATPGLSILDAAGNAIFGSGSTYALGLGGESLNFAPIFAAVGSGDYVASFQLHDVRSTGGFGGSGTFEYRFNAAVPEPGSIVMSAIGGLTMSAAALRKRLRNRRRMVGASA